MTDTVVDHSFFEKLLASQEETLDLLRSLSECPSCMMGAVILKYGVTLTMAKTEHAGEEPCIKLKRRLWGPHESAMGGEGWHEAPYCVNAIPAPLMAVLQCALFGNSVRKSILVCTQFPTFDLACQLIPAGFAAIIARTGKPDERTQKLLKECGIHWYVRQAEEGMSG